MLGKFGITVFGVALLAASGTAFAFGKSVSKEKLQDRTAFALGLVLFIITLILNILALRTVRNYREYY